MCILWFGIVHCGNGDTKFVVDLFSLLVFWHLTHCCRCWLICWSMPGHQYDCKILSFVLYCPSSPYMMFPCTSEISFCVILLGMILFHFLLFFSTVCCFQWRRFFQFLAFLLWIVCTKEMSEKVNFGSQNGLPFCSNDFCERGLFVGGSNFSA